MKVTVVRIGNKKPVVSEELNSVNTLPDSTPVDPMKIIEDQAKQIGQYIEESEAVRELIDDLTAQRDGARLQLNATQQALEEARDSASSKDETIQMLLEECRRLKDQLDAALGVNSCKGNCACKDTEKPANNVKRVAYIII